LLSVRGHILHPNNEAALARQLLTGAAQAPDSVQKFQAMMKARTDATSKPAPAPQRIVNPPPAEKPPTEATGTS
jgi:hypothetical protein